MQVQKLDFQEACVSKRSLVTIGNTAYYASPNGIAAIVANQGLLLTQHLITREDWQLFKPETMFGFSYQDDYGLLYDSELTQAQMKIGIGQAPGEMPVSGLLWIDLIDQDMRVETLDSQLAVLETKTERILTVHNESGWGLKEVYGAATTKTFSWRSKQFRFPLFINFSVLVVEADDYPVTIEIYGDEVSRYTVAVQNNGIQRLPSGYEAKVWEIVIDSQYPVTNVLVGTSVQEVMGV
jgi:hypothetical protein